MNIEPRTLEPELLPDELALLLSCVRSRALTGKHLEIGTAAGGTLKALMSCYPAEQRPKFVSVDTMKYFKNQLMVIKENLKSAGLDPDSVDFRKSRSWDALKAAIAKRETFSFIFIDGSHKINHVTEDIGWSALLDPGGIICFHDYSEAHPGVVSAVNRFRMRCPEYLSVGQEGSLIIFEKTRRAVRVEVTTADKIRADFIGFFWQLSQSLQKRLKTVSSKAATIFL